MRTRKQVARRRGLMVLVVLLAGLALGVGWWQARARTPVPASVQHLLMEFLGPSLRLSGSLRNRLRADPASDGPLTPVGQARLRQLEEENRRLRALLTLRDSRPTLAVVAEVLGRSRVPWQGYLVLDKGSEDGVVLHMVALTPEGVLGQVSGVSSTTTTVLPLTDDTSGIGAVTERTRAPGVLKGDRDGRCRLIYLTGEADVREGDLVLTSGLGRVFPRGLPLGRITAVTNNPALSSRVATVVPFANPATVEMVVLIAQ